MSSPATVNLSTVTTNGPLFIGTILNYLLTGILIHQLFDYNKDYPNDKRVLKWFVYGVCALDMLQTGLTTQFSWFYCVQNWGNNQVFSGLALPWTASTLPIMAGLIATIVQLFYAWRVWCLGGHWLKACSVAITIVAIMGCLCSFIGSIKLAISGIISPFPADTVPYFVIWLSASFVCDVLIAGCMTIIYVGVKTRTSFEKTSSVINILIRHVVETAAITALCAGVTIGLFLKTWKENQDFSVPAFVMGKLYTNCLLANLNSRRDLALTSNSGGSGNVINSLQLRKLHPRCNRKQNSAIVDLTAIRVDQVRHVQCDEVESSSATAHDVDNKSLDQDGNYAKDDASDAVFAYKSDATMFEQH